MRLEQAYDMSPLELRKLLAVVKQNQELIDGRKLGVPLAYFPRLLNASSQQCQQYEISGGGSGLHWDQIDEDISVENLLMRIGDRTQPLAHSNNLVA